MRLSAARGSWRADLALAAVVAVWGATFVLVKEALQDVSVLLFLALRFSLASLALALAFAGRYTGLTAVRRSLSAGCLAGLCLFLGYLFQTAGLRYTSASKSAFITALSVVMVPLLLSLVYRSVPGAAEAAGVVLATAGLGLMTLSFDNLKPNPGDVLTLVCALGFAVHVVVLGRFSASSDLGLLSLSQVATVAVVALGTFWWVETPRVQWTPTLLMALLVTGLLATALAFTVQAWAQRHTSPTRTALILALEPVFAWVTSFLLAGERLGTRGMIGGCLILGGVLLAELKPARARGHPLG
ncbi:MAG TPA: DMT family transporter [Bryobacteraceae bacterium]|nr:DMT family transporter [Bryobacteraceae bacterium]